MRLHITRALNPRQGENLKIYEKLVNCSEFKIPESITSFLTSSPGSLTFTILFTTRVFFIVITIGKARDLGTLSYLTDNS